MLLLALAAAALPVRVAPVDRCVADPSFVEFRAELRRTIARRDTDALLKLVADDVYASFGGHIGKKDFVELWGLKQRPRTSRLWKELGTALSLGCVIQNGVPVAPSLEVQLGGDRDAFETLVALPGSVLRRRPNDRSTVVARLSWHVLTAKQPGFERGWVEARLDDGRRGFIRRETTRSPIDYRAAFHKRGGRWLMTSFVAGD